MIDSVYFLWYCRWSQQPPRPSFSPYTDYNPPYKKGLLL